MKSGTVLSLGSNWSIRDHHIPEFSYRCSNKWVAFQSSYSIPSTCIKQERLDIKEIALQKTPGGLVI